MNNEYVLENSGSERCKACDAKFRTVFRKDIGQWEDLCHKCRPIAIAAAKYDRQEIDPKSDLQTEEVCISAMESEAFTKQWQDLNNDDDYYTGGDMGGYHYLDSYE